MQTSGQAVPTNQQPEAAHATTAAVSGLALFTLPEQLLPPLHFLPSCLVLLPASLFCFTLAWRETASVSMEMPKQATMADHVHHP